jgi:hypothetical protein
LLNAAVVSQGEFTQHMLRQRPENIEAVFEAVFEAVAE